MPKLAQASFPFCSYCVPPVDRSSPLDGQQLLQGPWRTTSPAQRPPGGCAFFSTVVCSSRVNPTASPAWHGAYHLQIAAAAATTHPPAPPQRLPLATRPTHLIDFSTAALVDWARSAAAHASGKFEPAITATSCPCLPTGPVPMRCCRLPGRPAAGRPAVAGLRGLAAGALLRLVLLPLAASPPAAPAQRQQGQRRRQNSGGGRRTAHPARAWHPWHQSRAAAVRAGHAGLLHLRPHADAHHHCVGHAGRAAPGARADGWRSRRG